MVWFLTGLRSVRRPPRIRPGKFPRRGPASIN